MEKTSTSRNASTQPFYQGDRNPERVGKRRQRKPRVAGQQKKSARKPQRRVQSQTLAGKQLHMEHQLQVQQRRLGGDCDGETQQQRTQQPQYSAEQQCRSVAAGDVVASTDAPDRFFLRFEGITAIVHREMLPLIDHFMTIVLELKAEVDNVKRNRDTTHAENRILQAQLVICRREHAEKCTQSQQSQTQQYTHEQQTQTQQNTREKQTQTRPHIHRSEKDEPHTPLQRTRRGIQTGSQQDDRQRQTPTQQTQPRQRPTEQPWPKPIRQRRQIEPHQSQQTRQYIPNGRARNSIRQQNIPQRNKREYYNRGRQEQGWKYKRHNNNAENEILTAIRKVGQMVAMSPATLQVPGPPEVLATSSAAAQSLNPASALLPMSWSMGAQQQFGTSTFIPMPNLSMSDGSQISPYWQTPYF